MALQVWLPLDGDLKNQGLMDIAVTNNGNAAVNNNGKIGKCYYFNGSSYLSAPMDYSGFSNHFSVAFWFKLPSAPASNVELINFGPSAGWAVIYYGVVVGSNLTLSSSVANGSSYIATGFNTTITTNRWYHYAFTFDEGVMNLYIDGVFIKTMTTSIVPALTNSTKIGIGAAPNGNEKSTSYMNDIRIYDHCLSYKEVSELAKGLILHYRLSKPQKNLLKNEIHTTSAWTWENMSLVLDANTNSLKMTTSAANGRIYNGLSNVWTQNKKYICSFDARSDTAGTTVDVSRSVADISSPITLGTTWQHYGGIINCTTTSSGGTLSIRVNQSGRVVYIKNIKLEEGEIDTGYIPPENSVLYSALGFNSNIELDCAPAGNTNDGTIVGTLTTAADSPRYSTSLLLNGVDSRIACKENLNNLSYPMTVSLWFKPSSVTRSKTEYIFSYNTDSGGTEGQRIGFGYLNGGSLLYVWCNGANYSTGQTLVNEKWYHIVMTVTNTNVFTVYLNGNNIYSITKTSPPASKWITVGCRSNSATGSIGAGDYFYHGQVSDLRVYCTALSASDIAELYHTAAQIDKDGNTYAYEFKEA